MVTELGCRELMTDSGTAVGLVAASWNVKVVINVDDTEEVNSAKGIDETLVVEIDGPEWTEEGGRLEAAGEPGALGALEGPGGAGELGRAGGPVGLAPAGEVVAAGGEGAEAAPPKRESEIART